jgi:hypothetical protein
MSSAYTSAIDLVQRVKNISQDEREDFALDVESLLDEIISIAEDFEIRLKKEQKASAYCMKKLSGYLTAGQWKYLEKITK